MYILSLSGNPIPGGEHMSKKSRQRRSKRESNPRLDPETRLAPAFDSASIAKFPIAEPGEMGFRVLDNFTKEHIQ